MKQTLVAAFALTVLAGAGCGAEESGGAKKPAPGGKAVQFSQCMRDNGVRDFPDPDPSGELTIDAVANGTSVDTDSAAFEQAARECKDLRPAGFTGRKRDAKKQDDALAFAACMRESGVEDFPDPAAGDPLVDTRRIPSTQRPGGMDALHAGMEKCGVVFGERLGIERP